MKILAIVIVLITAPANACSGCGLSRVNLQWRAVTKVMLETGDIDARYRLIQHVRGAPLWRDFPEERPITLGDLKVWHRAKRVFNKLSVGEIR